MDNVITMNNKHFWYDVIVAWASGEIIQFRNEYSNWIEFDRDATPNFNLQSFEWRIKPKTVTKKYRMAYIKHSIFEGCTCIEVTNSSLDFPTEYDLPGFVCWVGDIAEVEVEV